MNNCFTMYTAEIKKILAKKAVWIAMTIGLAFVLLVGVTNLSAEGHISYVKDSRTELAKIEGKAMDDSFFMNFQNEVIEELKANSVQYEKLMAYDSGVAFMNGANAIGKKSLFDFIYNVVRDRSLVETITGDAFYEKMREDIINDGRELGASEEEINVWLKEYDSINQPMKYYYAGSYSNILDVSFFVGWVLFLNIAVALAGVFADEKTYRTDAIILSTRKGRMPICLAKIAAGISVVLFQGIVIIGTLFGIMFAFFGAEGSLGMIQNVIPSSPWNITIGQMVGIFILLAMITTILFALTNMLLSHITHSSVATLAIHAAILFVGLFNVPKSLGIIAKLWQLRPTMALYYGTFCNTYRYGKMNNVEASVVIYGLCIAVLIVVLLASYRKSQVESR
ncbi:MAG: ABC transporter permease subunit [Eubacteriales bacterium]|nr:ABC transporter permease subunit [Eubacteriales bacterium]